MPPERDAGRDTVAVLTPCFFPRRARTLPPGASGSRLPPVPMKGLEREAPLGAAAPSSNRRARALEWMQAQKGFACADLRRGLGRSGCGGERAPTRAP